MKWLGLILAGPTLWALVFSAVYALHGMLCAGAIQPDALGLSARALLIGAWVLGLVAFWPLIQGMPAGQGVQAQLPRAGVWIGLVATVFTLMPVAFASSC